MLTKRDLEQIDELIKNRFQDFYDNLFEPLATRLEKLNTENEKQHEIFMKKMENLCRTDELHEDILRGHEGRITDLERKSF